jgi:hypothetical protein
MSLEVNEFGRPEIPSSQLTAEHVPAEGAPYCPDIIDFALSLDGYAHFKNQVAPIGNQALIAFNDGGKLPESIDHLRVCLFFEQRLWRNEGVDPDAQSMRFIRAVLAAIRSKVGRPR